MVIDSIQVNPFQLPLQAWPMAPVYGSSSLVPQGVPTPMVLPLVPLQAAPTLVPSQAVLQAEQQAINGFLQEAAAGPIRKLHEYLEAHSQQYSQLTPCIPLVQQAAQAFGGHDYAQALAQVYQAYRYITALRASIADLPSL